MGLVVTGFQSRHTGKNRPDTRQIARPMTPPLEAIQWQKRGPTWICHVEKTLKQALLLFVECTDVS